MSVAAGDRKTWERREGEPARWFARFEAYRLAGPARSLLSVVNRERAQKNQKAEKGRKRQTATKVPGAWNRAAQLWEWRSRAEAWDGYVLGRAAAEAEARRIGILTSGYAQQHERVETLNDLARLLELELHETDKRWVPDVKQIGVGLHVERVDLVRFNAALVREFRGVLDDLAAETGGRAKNVIVRTWQDEIVQLLREGKLPPDVVRAELGDDLATELFVAAGVPVGEDRET